MTQTTALWMILGYFAASLCVQIYRYGKQHNCPYCHGKEPLMESYDDPNFTVMISDYSKWLYIKGTGIGGSKDINYCPMCGRGL